MAAPTRYKSNLMRRLVEDMEGLDGIFAELQDPTVDMPVHPDRPRPDADRRRFAP